MQLHIFPVQVLQLLSVLRPPSVFNFRLKLCRLCLWVFVDVRSNFSILICTVEVTCETPPPLFVLFLPSLFKKQQLRQKIQIRRSDVNKAAAAQMSDVRCVT